MERMKYVMMMNEFCCYSPILFRELVNHGKFEDLNLVSAGFVDFTDKGEFIEVSVYGKSLDLNLGHRPEDADIICKMLNFGERNKFIPQEIVDPQTDFDIDNSNMAVIYHKGMPICYFTNFEKWNNGITEYAFDGSATPKQITACLKLMQKWSEKNERKYKHDENVLKTNDTAIEMQRKRLLAKQRV